MFTPDPLEPSGRSSTRGCAVRCPPDLDCLSVFSRVRVSRLVAGGSTVSWTLIREFVDPGPLVFLVEVSTDLSGDADAWETVGSVTDQYELVDDHPREFYVDRTVAYRVTVTSGTGSYVSLPARRGALLTDRDWAIAAATTRAKLTEMRVGLKAQRGFLLKRRLTTARCSRCLVNDRITDSNCPECYGTGYRCGFHSPAGCVWMEVKERPKDLKYNAARGPAADLMVLGTVCPGDMVDEKDLFIAEASDDRWVVEGVFPELEIRGLAVVAGVRLWLAPPNSVLYTIPRPASA